MSLITASLPATAPPAPSGARRLARDYWALADQTLISGSNFITMALVARALGPSGFGLFTLVYSALLFANMLQTALITQPHNVLGTARHGDEYASYTTSTLLSQLLLAGIEAAIAMAVAMLGRRAGWVAAPLLFVLAPAIVAWQLQEFVRRVLYTEGRHCGAFWNDAISYGGQVLCIAALALAGSLTALHAMIILAATSGAAGAIGLWQIRRSLDSRLLPGAFLANWNFGKWLAGSELLTWFSSIHMYLYLAGLLLGTVATGELKAAQVLFGPTRILASYLDTVLPIRFARRIAASGNESIRRDLLRLLAKVALPMTAYCLAAALLARPLLKVTFGANFAGAATVLVLYSIYALLTYFQLILTAALRARRATHLVFAGAACAVAVAFPLSLLLIPHLQTAGILLAMIAGVLAAGALYLHAALRDENNALATVVAKEDLCPN